MTREEHIENLKAIASDMPSDKCADWIDSLMAGVKALEQEPCGDAISRQAVMDALCDNCEFFKNRGQTCSSKCEEYHFLATLSPVTPQPKTGHWIDIMVGDMPAQACDQCNTFYPLAYTGGGHKYCPNCGAKMSEIQTGSEGREKND